MTAPVFQAGSPRAGICPFSVMASLRALQLLPNPEPDFLALRYRADLHTLALAWLTAGVDLVNDLHKQLDRPPTVDDVLRVLKSKPRAGD